jgi:hypothetical protein
MNRYFCKCDNVTLCDRFDGHFQKTYEGTVYGDTYLFYLSTLPMMWSNGVVEVY